jgi:hypothetical protein
MGHVDPKGRDDWRVHGFILVHQVDKGVCQFISTHGSTEWHGNCFGRDGIQRHAHTQRT